MRRSTIIALLVIVLILLIGLGYFQTNPDAASQALAELGLAAPPANLYTVSGILEAQTIHPGSPLGGRVIDLPVQVGQVVNQGEIIAYLDTNLLEIQLKASQAQLNAAQAQVAMVQAGARPVDIAVAEAGVDLASEGLKAAHQALRDAQEISENDPIRDEQIALAQSKVEEAKANLAQAQSSLDALKSLPDAADLAEVQAAFDAAQAEVNHLRGQIERQTLRAPITGIVLEKAVLPGELALPGWPVVSLANLENLNLTVYVPEGDLNWVSVGQAVTILVDAYPERSFTGVVTAISPEAEFTPRNVQTPQERVILVYGVQIKVPNPDSLLKPGLPADVVFEVQP